MRYLIAFLAMLFFATFVASVAIIDPVVLNPNACAYDSKEKLFSWDSEILKEYNIADDDDVRLVVEKEEGLLELGAVTKHCIISAILLGTC
ncbi:1278_t:CDS:2 [Acaulospora colombiana]|uniref:1278_t:CDS:1 n=1 Tax=Acaulospora colombiana TaxID=27376 RepID=A0ACA9KCX3_9GLOM|nr:1278_t:CDS:2 [Acaulospora colombiana]